VLISAGIGITPMNGILEHLRGRAARCEVLVLHADRSPATHPLRERQRQLVDGLPGADLEVWYSEPEDAPGTRHGLMDLTGVELPLHASFYVCGSNGFVQAVRTQLAERGVDPARVHCELFAPDEWVLG